MNISATVCCPLHELSGQRPRLVEMVSWINNTFFKRKQVVLKVKEGGRQGAEVGGGTLLCLLQFGRFYIALARVRLRCHVCQKQVLSPRADRVKSIAEVLHCKLQPECGPLAGVFGQHLALTCNDSARTRRSDYGRQPCTERSRAKSFAKSLLSCYPVVITTQRE